MTKSEYLDYLRARYERLSDDAKLAGFTAWGLALAIVYIIWKVIPDLALMKNDVSLFKYTVLMYGYIQISIVFSYLLVLLMVEKINEEGLGGRLRRSDAGNVTPVLFVVFLMLGLPCLSLFFLGVDYLVDDKFFKYQYLINIYFLGLIFLLISLVSVGNDIYERKSGYPSPLEYRSKTSRLKKISYIFWLVLVIEMFLGNYYSLYLLSGVVPQKSFSQICMVAFNISLLVVSVSLLVRNKMFEKI